MTGRPVPVKVWATLEETSETMVHVVLNNMTAHPVSFFIEGVVPECQVSLDGNTSYPVDLLRKGEAVRVKEHDGKVLAQTMEDEDAPATEA
jgi:hypothetical protein